MTRKAQCSGKSLVELLRDFETSETIPEIEIVDIVSNSQSVRKGSLFIAMQGINTHGIDFSIDAVKAGAVAVMYDAQDEYCDQRIPLLSKQIQTHWIPIGSLSQINGEIVSRFYDEPGKKLKIIGVTGTDGKSSVTHLLTQALGKIGKKVASIGTLGYGLDNQLQPTLLTTPDAVTLQAWLHEFYQQQCEYVVMEVSSHALAQFRVNGCQFEIAVLTNLGRDHLDYHGTQEQYADTKAKLFREFDLSSRVLNIDDELGLSLSQEFQSEASVRYSSVTSTTPADVEVRLLSSEVTDQGLDMRVATPRGEVRASTSLMGRFNIENTLACISSLIALGFDHDHIQAAISGLQPIPGRMEKFKGSSNLATVVVDFAHTEQALRACLSTCREYTSGQLWCIFGCGGDRDQGKRAGMGSAVEELADRVIITDDNPRTESPEEIVDQILKGMRRPESVCVVHNRQAAIEYAMSEASADDLVVIAGKGHEQEQIIGRDRIPFSDRHVVQRIIQAST